MATVHAKARAYGRFTGVTECGLRIYRGSALTPWWKTRRTKPVRLLRQEKALGLSETTTLVLIGDNPDCPGCLERIERRQILDEMHEMERLHVAGMLEVR